MFNIVKNIRVGIDGFDEHDLLDRKSVAKQLTELVDRIDDPMVIALDGGWGTGKTFFLKLWVGEHNKVGGRAKIIYFDAFAQDFLNDPLASLLFHLQGSLRREPVSVLPKLRRVSCRRPQQNWRYCRTNYGRLKRVASPQ